MWNMCQLRAYDKQMQHVYTSTSSITGGNKGYVKDLRDFFWPKTDWPADLVDNLKLNLNNHYQCRTVAFVTRTSVSSLWV